MLGQRPADLQLFLKEEAGADAEIIVAI